VDGGGEAWRCSGKMVPRQVSFILTNVQLPSEKTINRKKVSTVNDGFIPEAIENSRKRPQRSPALSEIRMHSVQYGQRGKVT
jgi:hypothetical protein